jgi:hypothetical protein
MEKISNLILIAAMLFVGVTALVGGIRKSPKPFFWLKKNNTLYLKTPLHYTIFGVVAILAAIFFILKWFKL